MKAEKQTFRVNYGKGFHGEDVVFEDLDQKTAIRYWKGLADYKRYAKIERKNEEGTWIQVKLVPKKT